MKTLTLTDDSGNPTLVTHPGHVDLKTFNRAFSREWTADPYLKREWDKDRRFEYYISHKTKPWKRVDPGTKGAKKFTVIPWD